MYRKRDIFLAILKILYVYIKEKANKKHAANSKIARASYSTQLTSNYRLSIKLVIFSSKQAYFASWHQFCQYIRQSTKHMQRNSQNTYKYYVKLLLGLIGVYSVS